MKTFTKLSIILFFSFVISGFGQKTGMFDTRIDFNTSSRDISCFVPGDYNEDNSYKLIIGMHPAGTMPMVIRDMLMPSAEQSNSILVCPHDPQYEGEIIFTALQWAIENYNIDESKIILTGYSAGGGTTMRVGTQHKDIFLGIIGIAPAAGPSYLDMSDIQDFPIGIILGSGDHNYAVVNQIVTAVENAGGMIKYIEKAGVDHVGPYFYSPEFTADWLECYNFILKSNFKVILSSPENEASVGQPITFEWSEPEGATGYELWIAKNEDFNQYLEKYNVTENTKTIDNLDENETYYWKVMAKSDDGDSPWSNVWSFNVSAGVPEDSPDLFTPGGNADDVEVPALFVWENMDNADLYHVEIYEVGTDTKVIDEILKVNEDETYGEYIFDIDPNTEYKWHVAAGNDAGFGEFSDFSNFTTIGIKVPETTSPEDKATELVDPITFTWNTIDYVDSYEIEIYYVSNDEEFYWELVESDDLLEEQSLEVFGFEPTAEYKWHMRVFYNDLWSDWSEFITFSTGSFTAIEENANSQTVQIFPNPAKDIVNFKMMFPNEGQYDIEIFNELGICIHSVANKYYSQGISVYAWEAQNYASGIYYYQIKGNNFSYSGKIILIH